MKRLITVCVLLILSFSCSEKLDQSINYTVTPLDDGKSNTLRVKMTISADKSGETILLFQDKAWGQDSLHNVISNIKVSSEEVKITPNKDSGWFSIKHPKSLNNLSIEYTLSQDSKGPLVTKHTYRPIINSDYFHIFSHNFFMLPKHLVDETKDDFNVSITWNEFPEEFNFINSFGSNQKYQEIKNTSEEEFHTAIFAGGDFKIYPIAIEKNNVNFAIRGDWEIFKDSTMVNVLKKTITAQRNFWQDHTQPYYAITLIPTIQEKGSSFQGSGLTNSFATNASNNEFLWIEGLVYLFNHELQHNWIGSLIRNDDEEKQYWFSEGFTEYYTIKNIARAKVYNLDKSYFIKEFNEFVKELYTSPVKEMPNSELNYETFWSGKEGVQKLPYRRGALFAFFLDNKIRKETNGEKSLDDLLLNFKVDAIENKQKIDHDYFIKTANKYLKEDLRPIFDNHIEKGQLFNLEEMYGYFGFEFNTKTKVFDLGFTFSDDKKGIASIDRNSEAYKSGLRKGDVFKSRSYYHNSIENKAEFTVVRDKKEIEISYYPVAEINLPQLKDNINNKSQLDF